MQPNLAQHQQLHHPLQPMRFCQTLLLAEQLHAADNAELLNALRSLMFSSSGGGGGLDSSASSCSNAPAASALPLDLAALFPPSVSSPSNTSDEDEPFNDEPHCEEERAESAGPGKQVELAHFAAEPPPQSKPKKALGFSVSALTRQDEPVQ